MRILFTSDLHSRTEAYRGFAATLESFDAGVIAGDLLDDYIDDRELAEIFRASPDDFLEELFSPEATLDDRLEAWRKSPAHSYQVDGLMKKEREIKAILNEARKPVLVVRGNHDCSPLASEGFFQNIHLRRVEVEGVPFVGYGWIGRELDPERQMDGFDHVESLIDSRTVLVTHCPPFQVLDVPGSGGESCSVGSRALAEAVKRARPRLHLFGHIHASAGISGTSVNGSYPRVTRFFGIDTVSGALWVENDGTRAAGPDPIALPGRFPHV